MMAAGRRVYDSGTIALQGTTGRATNRTIIVACGCGSTIWTSPAITDSKGVRSD